MNFLELRIPPVAITFIFATAMAALAYNSTTAKFPVLWAAILAGALALIGALVALAGVVAFRRHKTTVNPLTPEQSSSLVSSGIYRFSRNPMYLGFLLSLLGWSFYLGSLASALLLPVFVIYMNRFQIQPEERALKERFGPDFIAYSSSVRRWL